MLTLYHLAISHYSEKARWALDHLRLQYRSELLAPAFHILTVRRVGGGSTVPVLVDSDADVVLTDSTDILHYLDQREPERALFPRDPDLAARAAGLEDFFDEHCGKHVSGFFYHHLLQFPRVLSARWQTGLGPVRRTMVRAILPIVPRLMRRARNLDETTAREHRRKAMEAIDRLERELDAAAGDYLVGGRFTAADLAAASLIGPAVGPDGSPWDRGEAATVWSDGFPPPELAAFLEEVAERPAAEWVREIWARHRWS